MQSAFRLLKDTFEHAVKTGEVLPLPATLPAALHKPAGGIYVAAFENPGRKPRGRVGSYLPTKSTLGEEIQHQAVRLATTFPFRKQDLPFLAYELLLTKPPELLADLTELNPATGLLLRTSHGVTGVSLPGIHKRTPKERFTDAARQANISPDPHDIRLYTFAVEAINDETS